MFSFKKEKNHQDRAALMVVEGGSEWPLQATSSSIQPEGDSALLNKTCSYNHVEEKSHKTRSLQRR